MSESDDDDLEGGDQLKSMRAVWLSMRDEEPSDKGLAALMAAAREKADELKEPEPTFWRKLLATLRRPPVLALASVAILLGGALVIANRGDKAMVDERAETTAQAPKANTPPAPQVQEQAAGSAAPESFAAGDAGTTPVEVPPANNAAPLVEPPAKPRPARTKPPERKEEREAVTTTAPVAPPPPEPEPKAEAKIATDKLTEPTATVTRGPQLKPPVTQPSRGGGLAEAGADAQLMDGESLSVDTKTADEAESGRARARVLQLVKQCESAAARGDCAAVKALAAKIRSEDAATYKARVVKNTSIARCLE